MPSLSCAVLAAGVVLQLLGAYLSLYVAPSILKKREFPSYNGGESMPNDGYMIYMKTTGVEVSRGVWMRD